MYAYVYTLVGYGKNDNSNGYGGKESHSKGMCMCVFVGVYPSTVERSALVTCTYSEVLLEPNSDDVICAAVRAKSFLWNPSSPFD